MLKEAIEKILSLKQNATYNINGDTYSDNELVRIPKFVDRPKPISLSSLDSLVAMLKVEVDSGLNCPVFVNVSGAKTVSVYTTYAFDYSRNNIYTVTADTPDFDFGWREYDKAMIAFRSQFVQDDEVAYVLSLLSRITDEASVSSGDNGLSQNVTVKSGISLVAKETIRPHVTLRLYRTFLEVEQPKSEFLLRLEAGGRIGLFEADGGMWRLHARRTIAEYLRVELAECIDNGNVIVTT